MNREECEELRSTQSQRQRDELFDEREAQLSEKVKKKEQEEEIEQMYAELWDQDRQAKAHREELQAKEQMERNRDMVKVPY